MLQAVERGECCLFMKPSGVAGCISSGFILRILTEDVRIAVMTTIAMFLMLMMLPMPSGILCLDPVVAASSCAGSGGSTIKAATLLLPSSAAMTTTALCDSL